MSTNLLSSLPRGLELAVHLQDGTVVVRCSGRLVAGVTGVLKDRVKELIPQANVIVLDLTDLQHMDSSGLGQSLASMSRREGRIVTCGWSTLTNGSANCSG